MSKVRVHNFSISIDGFAAGPHQSRDHPVGINGTELHRWIFSTQSGRQMVGAPGGSRAIDDGLFRARTIHVGATVMGRNMFGPVRGPWGDSPWSGWWGDHPPFGHPVFVLTHHPHPSIEMDGGTTFRFVTDGLDSALERAKSAAGLDDVVIGGGVMTLAEALGRGLVDELHLVEVPVLLGEGERLFDRADHFAKNYILNERIASCSVTHLCFSLRKSTNHKDVTEPRS